MSNMTVFKNGIFSENPTFIQLLGMCPTLAVTTTLENGIGMGVAATAVLAASNVAISLLRRFIPEKVRIAAFVVVIAGFVTMVEMALKAYLPALASSLGIFIPLIVVNCIILARAEAFASKNSPLPSFIDGLGMGLGFTCALVIISAAREMLGNGTLLGFQIFGKAFMPISIMALPPGGFLTLGLILGVINLVRPKKIKRGSKHE